MIEAVRFERLTLLEGDVYNIQFDMSESLPKWVRNAIIDDILCPNFKDGKTLVVTTLEGEHIVSPGDWIIKGVEDELYPCKDSVFRATYDPVTTPEQEISGVAV
jgi:hypothetical protein